MDGSGVASAKTLATADARDIANTTAAAAEADAKEAAKAAADDAKAVAATAAAATAAANKKAKLARVDEKRAAAYAAMKAQEERELAEEQARQAAEKQAWADAKLAADARAAAKAKIESSAGETVLQAIERLAAKAVEAEQHVERLARLEKTLGPVTVTMRQSARKKSHELQDEMAKMLDGSLEEAFKQFDIDGNGSLDKDELSEAYNAAGMPISAESLTRYNEAPGHQRRRRD